MITVLRSECIVYVYLDESDSGSRFCIAEGDDDKAAFARARIYLEEALQEVVNLTV